MIGPVTVSVEINCDDLDLLLTFLIPLFPDLSSSFHSFLSLQTFIFQSTRQDR